TADRCSFRARRGKSLLTPFLRDSSLTSSAPEDLGASRVSSDCLRSAVSHRRLRRIRSPLRPSPRGLWHLMRSTSQREIESLRSCGSNASEGACPSRSSLFDSKHSRKREPRTTSQPRFGRYRWRPTPHILPNDARGWSTSLVGGS